MSDPAASSILDRLTDILRDVFDQDDLVATPQMTARDVEGWDSLGNVQVFLAVEQRFKVRFSAAEIGSIDDVGDLVAMIAKKSA